MNKIMIIQDKQLLIKEFNEQRVVTFKDIDMLHQRPEGTASRNFLENKKHLIEGEDFFLISKNQNNEIRGLEIPNRGLNLITQSGYLMLVKSFNDDLAWKVQRQLVNTYFKSSGVAPSKTDILKEVTNAIKLISNPGIRDRAMTVALEEILGVNLIQKYEFTYSDYHIQEFLTTCCEIEIGKWMKSSPIYAHYLVFCKNHNYIDACTKNTLGRVLALMGVPKRKTMGNSVYQLFVK